MNWKGEEAIVEYQSAPLGGGLFARFWVTSAKLDTAFDQTFGGRFAVPIYGLGWGGNRKTSLKQSTLDALLWQVGSTLGDRWGLSIAPASCPAEQGLRESSLGVISLWVLEQIEHERDLGLLRQTSELRRIREWRLIKDEESSFELYTVPLEFASLTAAIATYATSTDGILVSCEVAESEEAAISAALRALFIKKRKLHRILHGQEQILDRMEDQRLFFHGTNPKFKETVTRKIKKTCEGAPSSTNRPRSFSQREVHGPWNPDYRVFKTEIADLLHPSRGSLERWVN